MAAPGSVSYNADFKADTSQGQQSLRDYQSQIKAVRNEIAQATKDARGQFQQQMLAARASGASSQELAKIQQAQAQSQLAIKNTQKELSDAILQGNYSALQSEEALEAVRKQALATLQQQLVATQKLASTNSGHAISNQSAASGAVQFLEGRNGIRTVENFLGNSLGLGGFFSMMSPVIGAVQSAKLIADLGEKVYEFRETGVNAGKAIRQAFEELADTTHKHGVELDLANDKLDTQIAKLEHKPNNALKTALDEDRKAAYELTSELGRSAKSAEDLFKQYGVSKMKSFGMSLLGYNLADTKDQQKLITDTNSDLRKVNRSGDDALDHATPQNAEAVRQQDRINRQNAYTDAIRKTQSALDAVYANQREGKGVDFSGQTGLLEGQLDELKGQLRNLNSGYSATDKGRQLEGLQEGKRSSSDASEAARKALEEQRKAADDQRKQWENDFKAAQAAGAMTHEQVVQFWVDRENQTKRGSGNYLVAEANANAALKADNDEKKKLAEERIKMIAQFGVAGQKDIFGVVGSWGKGQADAIKSQKDLQDAQASAKYEVAQSTVQFDLAAGRISKYDAAAQLQTLHTMRYEDALNDLNTKLGSISGGPEAEAQRNSVRKQITELDAKRSVEVMQDTSSIAQNTVSGALKQANEQWMQNTQDLAPQITSIYTSVFAGMNDQLANLLTGQKTSWSSFFAGIASQFAKLGLNMLEGDVAHALGAKSSSGSGSAIGGVVRGIFGGFRANGGPVEAGKTYIVGERGPEPVTFGSSGYVTSNAKAAGTLGSGTHNWNIAVDARGASNPAEVEAAAHRAVMTAAPQIVAASLRAQKDQQARNPYSKR